MRTLKLITPVLIMVVSGGCTFFLPQYNETAGTVAYQPNADGPAATLGASAIIPAQHIAYASNQSGAPGAFGPGTARFNGLSLEAFSMDGELSAIPPMNAQTGFFLRPTTTLSTVGGRGDRTFSRGYGGVLSESVLAGADTLIAWGRWSGTTAHLITRSNLVPLGEFYYVVGESTPVARLPQPPQQILAHYQFKGGADGLTQRLLRDIGPTRLSGSLSVLWGPATPKVGLDVTWLVTLGNGLTAGQLRTNGGTGDPSGSEISVRPGTATFGGTGISYLETDFSFFACNLPGCAGTVEGFFAGPDAERAGLSFQVSSSGNPLFSGALAFALDGAPAPAPAPTPAFVPLDPAGPFGMVRAGGPDGMPTSLDSLGVMTQNQATLAIDGFGQAAFTQELARGTAQSADAGGDALITWGRWTNGSYEMVQSFGNAPIALGAEQALHYVIGAQTPAANMPASGTAAFSLMGATQPTFGDGAMAAGTLTGSMAVAWGGSAATRVGMDLTVTMPGDASYSIVTTGGLANPAASQVQTFFNAQFTGTVPVASAGRACAANPAGCGANIAGFFAGPAAERAGIAYQLGSGSAPQSIHGAAAFTR